MMSSLTRSLNNHLVSFPTWYSRQRWWVRVLCLVPLVLTVGVMAVLAVAALMGRGAAKRSPVDEQIDQTLKGLDAQLKEASVRVDEARTAQAELQGEIDGAKREYEDLQDRIDVMNHRQLKQYMDYNR